MEAELKGRPISTQDAWIAATALQEEQCEGFQRHIGLDHHFSLIVEKDKPIPSS